MSDESNVKSAVRVLDITEEICRYPSGLTFVEILEALDIPKSSLHGILKTMTTRGYLVVDPDTRAYRVGVRFWEAGRAFESGADLIRVYPGYLERARNELGRTVHLSILDGLENVYIAKMEANEKIALVSRVGGRLPAYSTGLGKMLLATLDEDELSRRLRDAELQQFTERTITDKELLRAELSSIRVRGYAVDQGEYMSGVHCVAVPVRNHTGDAIAAMSCSLISESVDQEKESAVVSVLKACAAGLSEALGYRGGDGGGM